MSVIHNDGNDHNILINHKHKTFGIIDFGDMIHSFHIIEPAVAIAYIYLDNLNPFENVYAFLKGYHTVFPLETIELKLILLFHVHAPMYNGNYVSLAKKVIPI